MNRLIIRRPGSVLSVITDRELTEEQTKVIEFFIDVVVESTPAEMQQLWAAMTDPLEPLTGIEQYQAESR